MLDFTKRNIQHSTQKSYFNFYYDFDFVLTSSLSLLLPNRIILFYINLKVAGQNTSAFKQILSWTFIYDLVQCI